MKGGADLLARRLSHEEREARVRQILSFPAGAPHAAVSAATGYSRETVRRVRFGMLWADVLPQLERMERDGADARCHQCVQWEPRGERSIVEAGDRRGCCALGIPECATEGMTWARGCGAFSRRR